MVRRPRPPEIIPAAALLTAYSRGIFPMAEERDDEEVFWVDPDRRGILPLDAVHVSHRLARRMRAMAWRMTADSAFGAVIEACAAPAKGRPKTWINGVIERSYCALAAQGHAHSVEVWDGDELIGGLYGVSIGGAFFGESMFSRRTDASKIALLHLVARLKAGRYKLLDVQFVTDHLKQFGTVEIPRARYQDLLKKAVAARANFYEFGGAGAAVGAGAVLQLITQTS